MCVSARHNGMNAAWKLLGNQSKRYPYLAIDGDKANFISLLLMNRMFRCPHLRGLPPINEVSLRTSNSINSVTHRLELSKRLRGQIKRPLILLPHLAAK